jgi:hypothetical protein
MGEEGGGFKAFSKALFILAVVLAFVVFIVSIPAPPPIPNLVDEAVNLLHQIKNTPGTGTMSNVVIFYPMTLSTAALEKETGINLGVVHFCVEPLPEDLEEGACYSSLSRPNQIENYTFWTGSGQSFEGSSKEVLKVKQEMAGRIRVYRTTSNNTEIWIGFNPA